MKQIHKNQKNTSQTRWLHRNKIVSESKWPCRRKACGENRQDDGHLLVYGFDNSNTSKKKQSQKSQKRPYARRWKTVTGTTRHPPFMMLCRPMIVINLGSRPKTTEASNIIPNMYCGNKHSPKTHTSTAHRAHPQLASIAAWFTTFKNMYMSAWKMLLVGNELDALQSFRCSCRCTAGSTCTVCSSSGDFGRACMTKCTFKRVCGSCRSAMRHCPTKVLNNALPAVGLSQRPETILYLDKEALFVSFH